MPITLNQSLQDRILRLMAEDDDFLAMVAGRLEPSFFLSSLTETLAKICLDYKAQFGCAPKDHFADEAIRVFSRRSEDDRADCLRYLQRLKELPKPNPEYLIRRISDAIKLKARENAAIQFAELVGQGKSEEADLVMYDCLKSGIPAEEDEKPTELNLPVVSDEDLAGVMDRADDVPAPNVPGVAVPPPAGAAKAKGGFSETAWFMAAVTPEQLAESEGEALDFVSQELMTERYETDEQLPPELRRGYSLTATGRPDYQPDTEPDLTPDPDSAPGPQTRKKKARKRRKK